MATRRLSIFLLGALLSATCTVAPSQTAVVSSSATPSASPAVISTRLLAELIGQLVLEGSCLRIQSQPPGESPLLVFAPDFTATVSGDTVLIVDQLEHQQVTWHVGETVGAMGGYVSGPIASPLPVPAGCAGPYFLFNGWFAAPAPSQTPGLSSATPTPVTAITRERAIEIAVQGCRMFHMVLVGEPRNIRAQLLAPSRVWQVQLDGLLQLIGGPAPDPATTALPPTPFQGTCTALLDATTGELSQISDVPLAGYPEASATAAPSQTPSVSSATPAPTLSATPAPPGVTELAQGGLVTFTDTVLGITFNYQPIQFGVNVRTRVDGARVYVYYDDNVPDDPGQYVEVRHKDPAVSLEQAIQKQILSGYAAADCMLAAHDLAEDSGAPAPDGYRYAMILPRVPPTVSAADDAFATEIAQAQKCPPVYTAAGGDAYFMEDTRHPERFFFFKIGQYSLFSAGPAGADVPWQSTLRVIDEAPAPP